MLKRGLCLRLAARLAPIPHCPTLKLSSAYGWNRSEGLLHSLKSMESSHVFLLHVDFQNEKSVEVDGQIDELSNQAHNISRWPSYSFISYLEVLAMLYITFSCNNLEFGKGFIAELKNLFNSPVVGNERRFKSDSLVNEIYHSTQQNADRLSLVSFHSSENKRSMILSIGA